MATKIKNSGFEPDLIVAISRGGLVLGRLMSDYFGAQDLRIIKMEHYSGVKVREDAKIETPIQGRLDGRKVLLVDDVADRGDTLVVAVDHLKDLGASEVRVATLHYKPWSKLVPDHYLAETDCWVVYWWERAETARSLLNKLGEEGFTREQALNIIKNEAEIPAEVIEWLSLE